MKFHVSDRSILSFAAWHTTGNHHKGAEPLSWCTNALISSTIKLPGYMGPLHRVSDVLRRVIVPIRHTDRNIMRMESDELSMSLRYSTRSHAEWRKTLWLPLHLEPLAANMSGSARRRRRHRPQPAPRIPCGWRGHKNDSRLIWSNQARKLHSGSNEPINIHLLFIFCHRCDRYLLRVIPKPFSS